MEDSNNRQKITAGVLTACVLPTVITWLYFVALENHPLQKFAFALKVGQFLFPVLFVLFALRETIFSTGLAAALEQQRATGTQAGAGGKIARLPKPVGLGLGVSMGILVCVAMWIIYQSIPEDTLAGLIEKAKGKVQQLGFGTPVLFIGLGVFYSLFHSFLEEYYFRWFVFGQLRRTASFWPAAVFSGLAFMAHHVIILVVYFGWSPLAIFLSVSIAVGGVLWAWLYEKTGTLLGPWISHLLVDAGIFYIGFDLLRNARII